MGKNKAADMHKENEVKLLKDHIRGLGANKTEKSIVAMSKAAPVISSIASNFDSMLSLKKITTKHKKRSSTEDIQALIQILQKNFPWHVTHRNLPVFNGIEKSPFAFNLCLYKTLYKGYCEIFLNHLRMLTEMIIKMIPQIQMMKYRVLRPYM
jgi:hypothetical protein